MALQLIADRDWDRASTDSIHQARGMAALTIVRARSLDDARVAIELLRSNTTTLVQVGDVGAALQRRISDLLSGALCAMDGEMARVSDDVLLLRPRAVQDG